MRSLQTNICLPLSRLTALGVAKNEHRALFGEAEILRSSSALSQFTVRATASLASLASMTDWVLEEEDEVLPSSPLLSSPSPDPMDALFFHLQATSLPFTTLDTDIPALEASVQEASWLSETLSLRCKRRTEAISHDLDELRSSLQTIASLRDSMALAVNSECIDVPLLLNGLPRVSQDSQKTLVRSRSSSLVQEKYVDVEDSSPPESFVGRRSETPGLKRPWTKNDIKSGTLKLTSWLRQKIAPIEIFSGILDEPALPKDSQLAANLPNPMRDGALRTSPVVLRAVEDDLACIMGSLDSVSDLSWIRVLSLNPVM